MPTPRATSAISDPERIRALAHPIRLALLDLLSDTEEATATHCAQRLGESVASCSFHLRMLEKYGFVVRAAQQGREKPWRAVQRSWDLRASPDQPGSLQAVQELAGQHLSRAVDRIRGFLTRADREPPEWIDASTVTTSSFWATAEEMAELSRDVQGLTDRFTGRHDDPSGRPPGSRPAHLFAVVNPDPEPES